MSMTVFTINIGATRWHNPINYEIDNIFIVLPQSEYNFIETQLLFRLDIIKLNDIHIYCSSIILFSFIFV